MIDVKKCETACDLMLGALANDDNIQNKIGYYQELRNLISEYKRLKDLTLEQSKEIDKLTRDNFGLNSTVQHLQEKVERYTSSLGWSK